jgi:CHAT domain-containing protein
MMTLEEHAEENRLRGDVNSLNAQISKISAADKEKLGELKIKLETARTALARFQTNLYAAHPELRIKRGAVKPIEISEVGNLLDEKSALLEYTVADDAVLLFVFTKTNKQVEFKTYRINVGRDELTKRIGQFRQMLADRNVLFAAESRALYELLLSQAAAQLAGKTNLTIVPDDGLWELPFQALQTAENRYVLDDASVSYSPSLTILRELRGNQKQTTSGAKTLLAFGNPTDGASKINVNFAVLPEAERQTLALKNLYGAGDSSVFNRNEASETALKREAAKGFSILHLATHGVLDNNSPLNSYVLLAPNSATGDDGKLEAWEILEMNLNSDLVVLSACETARGQARSGEGLIGLAWSLMVAGARNVVVSQWKVESASTTNLTVDFYKSLKQNSAVKKPQALRQAALKLRRNPMTAHPFYWAGFVLIGEAE